MRQITLITTGGTIEKTYDEHTGELTNRRSVVRRMLARLRLEDTAISIIELLHKDSLLMTEEDRGSIVKALAACGADRDQDVSVAALPPAGQSGAKGGGGGGGTGGGVMAPAAVTRGVVILHGTDTLAVTGEFIMKNLKPIAVPIVLTGAMRPFEMVRSDALQNLTEAMFAVGVLPPGVYCAAHGRVMKFPGVRKDRERGTFVASA